MNKPKVLYIGDSIAHNANFAAIEKETNSRINTIKAYSSIKDSRATWPNKNLTDVTPFALTNTYEEDAYTHLVIAAPTVDISNMNTSKLFDGDNVEVYKQNVITSCHNTLAVAHNALQNLPNLEKVVVMEHAPRFDEENIDPTGLKPMLAKLANSTFAQMWHSSMFKDKLVIGKHSLDCTNDQRDIRYRDERSNRYDGVHMYSSYGKRAFTRSVTKILKALLPFTPQPYSSSSCPHSTCLQAMYQKERKTERQIE